MKTSHLVDLRSGYVAIVQSYSIKPLYTLSVGIWLNEHLDYQTSRYRYPTPVPIRVCPRAICPGWVWDCCIQNKVVCSIPPLNPSSMGLGRQVLPRCRVDMWSGDSADTLELPPKVKPSPRDGSSPQPPCRAPPPGSCPAPRGSTWSGCRAPCPQR